MSILSLPEIRLIISNSASDNDIKYPNEKSIENSQRYYSIRISLVKTLKTYVKKYYQSPDKYNVLYLSIAYLDSILSKNRISLSHDKNLKYLCLCCFLLSLKFIGNYNYSKKIISNFCKNYKQEYKIFEIQCLILLEHHLSYTTVYDFLNMIAFKENKQFLAFCNYYLYQICEDKIYTIYPPFYISIAIFQLAKKNTNNMKKNHYDKYFKDERVKILVKRFNDIINPSIINDILDNNNDNFDYNHSDLSHKNSFTNVNIFNNNNIQNNIVIINSFTKNNENNIEDNFNTNMFLEDNPNNTPQKIVKKLTDNINKNTKEKNKMNLSTKSSNIVSNSQRLIDRLTNYNINYNILNRISLKQNNKDSTNEIYSYKTSNKRGKNNDTLYQMNTLYKKNYKNNTTQIKKNFIDSCNKTQDYFTNNIMKEKIVDNERNNSKEKMKKYILNNKSSLNFQLVSGISKEKLLRLSRNISKTIMKTFDGNV